MAVMTSDADTVALLERALDQTAGLIAAIEPGQAGLATPCAGWDVRTLVGHLIGQDLRNFLVSTRGETADWQAPPTRSARTGRRRSGTAPSRCARRGGRPTWTGW
jgi:uncharacterized protein (TIGR03083 family)